MNGPGMELAFYGLSAIILGAAVVAVTVRNIAHAAFSLLPCFLALAGMYAALDAHFFFVSQVLIYAGAILVLFIFALMLTRDLAQPHVAQRNHLVFWAIAISTALAGSTVSLIAGHPWRTVTQVPPNAGEQTKELGRALIGPYAFPFEAASLILLAAMMGAVVLASARRERPAPIPATVVAQEPAAPLEEQRA